MRGSCIRPLTPVIVPLALLLLALSSARAQIDYSKIDVRKASDIAVNTMGALWTVGSDPASVNSIQRLVNGSLVTQPGAALRIAVDPNGNPWIVNQSGDVFHWEKSGSAPESWVNKNLKAMDVGVGRSGAVWAVGTDHRILKFENGTWTAISGAGDKIAVDNGGNPWVVNSNHEIWYYNGAWSQIPGKAQDVAVAPDGTVFIVGETQRPGGFQIQRRASPGWVDVPGAEGIAVAATRSILSVAQAPGSQVVSVNVPVYTAPAQPVTVNTPVIARPIEITTQPGNAIPVSGPATSATSATPMPPTPAGAKVRVLFWRDRTDEARMLKAIRYGTWGDRIFLNEQYPPASSLSTLERAFAHLAMLAAEDYYSAQPQITPDQVLSAIGSETNPNARRAVAGILSGLLYAKVQYAIPDAETMALRDWGTQLWRNHKIVAAKATLDEYLKWKQDPCGYEKKAAGECKTMAELFTTRTPPEAMFSTKAADAIFAKGAPELVATAGILASSIGGAIAGAVMASALGPGVSASGASVVYSLMGTFGGQGAQLIGVGSAGLGGVFAAAGLMAVIVGTTEGYKVVTAMRVEPMLRAKVGVAMTQPIVIENEIDAEAARNFFYIAAVNAALNRFVIPTTNVDGELRYYNQGGYVGRMIVSYTLNGKSKADTTAGLAVGAEQTVVIPVAATGITAKAEWSDLGITWRNFWTLPFTAPTYIGYTSYGTTFSPQVKEGYPEIENIKGSQNTLTLTHGGGYVAMINMSYMQGGKTIIKYSKLDTTAGWHQDIAIPADATNIYVEIFSRTGLVGEPLKAVFVKTWRSPPNECVKVYGTTLDPLWNSECK